MPLTTEFWIFKFLGVDNYMFPLLGVFERRED